MSRSEPVSYVVQMRRDGDAAGVWEDVAEVTVPPRTKRKTVLEKALGDANVTIEGMCRFRVIPGEHADPIPVRLRPRDPELVIGGDA